MLAEKKQILITFRYPIFTAPFGKDAVFSPMSSFDICQKSGDWAREPAWD